tara:strand:+ start:2715 stop:2894 length:180 start_codon:yes stop_codon:yes gene_type:complete
MELLIKRLQAKEAEIAQLLTIIETLQQQHNALKEEHELCMEKNLNQKNQNQSLKKEKGK